MPRYRQGEVVWAELPQPAGRRPVLILTRDDALAHLNNVTVAPLTRTIRHIKSEVVLSPAQGVPSVCAVSLDNLMTIGKSSLGKSIAQLDADLMRQVFDAIRHAFAMPA